ncbi:MAG: L,D-transpeptidase [Chloroflexota bacterium]|jgi:lipoprotein-anchoring transpeptidase ErfK/SrfK
MKRYFLLVLAAVMLAAGFLLQPAAVQAQAQPPTAGKPLCLPDVYLIDPQDCLPLGPAQKLTEMAKMTGLTTIGSPLPAYRPAPELARMPVSIARINLPNAEKAPLFATLEDAIAGNNPTRFIDPGRMRFVSYIQVQFYNDNPWIRLRSGEWMRASPVGYSSFQGLIFKRTPANNFGWIMDTNEVRSAPGYAAPKTGRTLYRENVVQIYAAQNADNTDWFMIGVDEWVERRFIRQVVVNTTPPEGVTNDRWIEINLFEQTLVVYENHQLVFATLVATGGDPYFTRPGLHQIYEKKELETMSGAFEADRSDYYYLQDVPWTMYFDAARALHGAYWRTLFGYAGSAGCVNLSIGDSRWLFDWAKEGDWVYVWDPSGQTPTDPHFYGAGGA